MLKKVFLSSALLMLVSGFTWCPNPCAVEDEADEISLEVASNDKIEVMHAVDSESISLFDDTTFFAFDSSDLTEGAKIRLDGDIDYLNSHENKDSNVLVVGHCDERGTREYNIALGERRANAVKLYLVSHGVDSNRIRVDSMGKEALRCDTTNPIYEVVSGDTDVYHKQNRRAVLSLDSGVIDHHAIKEQESMRCEINSRKGWANKGHSSLFGSGSKSLFGRGSHTKRETQNHSNNNSNATISDLDSGMVWDICTDSDEGC